MRYNNIKTREFKIEQRPMEENIIKFKNKLIKENKNGLALDIDETLSFTIGLMVERLITNLGNPENLTATEIIKKYKHTDNIPYWQSDTAKTIMAEIISSNEIQKDLPLIKNANKVVNKINKIVPIVAYITVRPESISEGTKFWLEKHGFPKAELIMKPENVLRTDGNKWKAQVLEYLYPQVLGIVDDNPGLTNFLSEDYQGTIYLYNNTDSKRNDIDIIPCETWERVETEVKKRMIKNVC
jgi:hypothetical protein